MAGASELPPILTVENIISYMQISKNSAYKWVEKVESETHEFIVKRIGKQYRIPREPFLKWLYSS